jgi:hypothetical protein
VPASGAVVVVVAGERMLVLFWFSTFTMMVTARAVMVMAGMFRDLMAGLAAIRGSMRVAPRRQQTVGQMEQNCTEGDKFEPWA